MSKKPQKRLVTWKEYISALWDKYLAYAKVMITFGGAVLLFLVSDICFRAGNLKEMGGWIPPVMGAGLVVLGLAALRVGKELVDEAKQVESVELITRHNTGDLPEVETLVRASGLPPSDQQAELLRPAPQGSETPPEELLRASVTRGPGGAVDHE